MYEFLHKTLNQVNAKNSQILENMYFFKKEELIEEEHDTNNAVNEYKLNAMNPKRLVAKLEQSRLWKKNMSQTSSLGISDIFAKPPQNLQYE